MTEMLHEHLLLETQVYSLVLCSSNCCIIKFLSQSEINKSGVFMGHDYPVYPESATAMSLLFINETNAFQASIMLLWPTRDGPWIHTIRPVTMHTPTSYLSPLPLNLLDIIFSKNFIWTGISVPSRVTNALLPQSPKNQLSHTICEYAEWG